MNEKSFNFSPYSEFRFNEWGELAIILDSLQYRLSFNEREVWSCYLGMNIGDEEIGKGDDFLRPVIIMRKFNNNACWVVPLSYSLKKSEYYFIFQFGTGKPSAAMFSQLRFIDAKRLHKIIGILKKKDFEEIKKRLMKLLS